MRVPDLVPISWHRGYVFFDIHKHYAEDGLFSLHDAGFRL